MCVDKRGGYSIDSKIDMVKIAMREGILPNDLNNDGIKEIIDISTFEDLCNMLSNNTIYDNPERVKERKGKEKYDAGETYDVDDDPDL